MDICGFGQFEIAARRPAKGAGPNPLFVDGHPFKETPNAKIFVCSVMAVRDKFLGSFKNALYFEGGQFDGGFERKHFERSIFFQHGQCDQLVRKGLACRAF
jgi:hypothetical protein